MAIRPPRAAFSVARRMGERARAGQSQAEQPSVDVTAGFAGMADALRGLVERLAEATKEQAQESGSRSFTIGGKDAKMVFGYTLKMGENGVSAEPFGDVPAKDAAPKAAEPAPRQPIAEVYEDGADVVVVAELPGADPAGIVCRPDGQTLLIETSGARRYRKELALPVAVRAEGMVQSFQNGILEVRLPRVAAA